MKGPKRGRRRRFPDFGMYDYRPTARYEREGPRGTYISNTPPPTTIDIRHKVIVPDTNVLLEAAGYDGNMEHSKKQVIMSCQKAIPDVVQREIERIACKKKGFDDLVRMCRKYLMPSIQDRNVLEDAKERHEWLADNPRDPDAREWFRKKARNYNIDARMDFDGKGVRKCLKLASRDAESDRMIYAQAAWLTMTKQVVLVSNDADIHALKKIVPNNLTIAKTEEIPEDLSA